MYGFLSFFPAGNLVMFNYGNVAPLQYTAAAAFIASLFADYLITADIPVWQCGPEFYSADVLKEFAQSQVCFSRYYSEIVRIQNNF